jgi:hypothetical protein
MVVYERIVEQRFPPTQAAGPLLRMPNRANARFPPNLTVHSHPCTALDEAGTLDVATLEVSEFENRSSSVKKIGHVNVWFKSDLVRLYKHKTKSPCFWTTT